MPLRHRPLCDESESLRTSTIPTQTTSEGPKVPHSITAADVLIIGGGPCGCFIASLLDQRGLRTTMLERIPKTYVFDISRSYNLALNLRGQTLMEKLPVAMKYLLRNCASPQSYSMAFLKMDGSIYKPAVKGMMPGHKPGMLFLRPRLVEAFQSYVDNDCPSVHTVYGALVTNIQFADSGVMTVSFTDGGETRTMDTRLILACDGANSAVLKHLREEAEASPSRVLISTSNGLSVTQEDSPSTNHNLCSIILSSDFYKDMPNKPDTLQTHVCIVTGRTFKLFIPPIRPVDVQCFNGLLASISASPEHALWSLRGLEEAFQFFENNFPQLDIRSVISDQSMLRFLNATPIVQPRITRVSSLVAHVGSLKRGGVVLLGDAAHPLPVDIGQGMNSALEDASILTHTFDDAHEDTPLHQILANFEANRMEDIIGLFELATFAFAPNSVPNRSRFYVWVKMTDLWLRIYLAKRFPTWFHPTTSAMFALGLSYATIRKRQAQTTRRMIAIVVLLLLLTIIFSVILAQSLRHKTIKLNHNVQMNIRK